MNGFRRNLHSDLVELKEQVKQVLDDEWFDKEELSMALDKVICASNGLNCVWVDGDEHFTNMEDLYLPLIDEDGEE
ncbi:hypothetical protein BA893_16105 [Vibrio natriegens]|nr:hypothetical protein BA893_16105 [Vibrio natriegens]